MKYLLLAKIKKFTFSTTLLLQILPTAKATVEMVDPTINAKAYVLMDYHSDEILVQYNAQHRLNPANLTKIMARLCHRHAMKAGKVHPDDLVTVGKYGTVNKVNFKVK